MSVSTGLLAASVNSADLICTAAVWKNLRSEPDSLRRRFSPVKPSITGAVGRARSPVGKLAGRVARQLPERSDGTVSASGWSTEASVHREARSRAVLFQVDGQNPPGSDNKPRTGCEVRIRTGRGCRSFPKYASSGERPSGPLVRTNSKKYISFTITRYYLIPPAPNSWSFTFWR